MRRACHRHRANKPAAAALKKIETLALIRTARPMAFRQVGDAALEIPLTNKKAAFAAVAEYYAGVVVLVGGASVTYGSGKVCPCPCPPPPPGPNGHAPCGAERAGHFLPLRRSALLGRAAVAPRAMAAGVRRVLAR